MKAIDLKNWCTENITPQAWSRIILKSIPELREKDINSNGLQEPPDDLELPEDALVILKHWLNELYEISIEEEAFI